MSRNQRPVASAKSEVVASLPLACSDETAAVEFFERQRWGDAPACVHCGCTGVYMMRDAKTGARSARFLWRCKACGKQFTVRLGTVLEDSRIPLRHWAYAFWAACASKKGVSAKQIQRQTGLSYRSALFLMHRIRFAMADGVGPLPKLSGVVEVDETYIGGKPRVRGPGNKTRVERHTPVLAMVERGGDVRARTLPRVDSYQLQRAIIENVDLGSRLMTDQLSAYPAVGARFAQGHSRVMHSADEYVRREDWGKAHTNTVEGFFAILKRGMVGTFHSVSKKHLHRYVGEFQFRYNTRKLDDGARIVRAIKAADGKRLTYKAQVAG